MSEFRVRAARSADVRGIRDLLEPYVQRRILLGKDLVVLYEAVEQFVVAEDESGTLIGCGALHVIWEDLGEVRTLIVADEWLHHGVGRGIVGALEQNARSLGLSRLFCLTFEVDFFHRRGFEEIGEQVVDPDALQATALDLTREIAQNAPLAVQGVKRAVNFVAYRGFEEAAKFEAMASSVLWSSDDVLDGFAAKARKEQAEFEGK